MPTKPAAGSTKIAITLPNDLLAVLDDAAMENRSRSNLIAHSLRRLKQLNPCLGEARSSRAQTHCPKVTGKPCVYRAAEAARQSAQGRVGGSLQR